MSQPSRPKATKLQKGKDKALPERPTKDLIVHAVEGVVESDSAVSTHKNVSNAIAEKYEILLERLHETGISKNYIFHPLPLHSHFGLDIFIPVIRTTLETINPNGFTPYDKKQEELLYKYYVIDLVESNNPYVQTKEDIEISNKLKEKGITYLKSGDINFVFNTLREIR